MATQRVKTFLSKFHPIKFASAINCIPFQIFWTLKTTVNNKTEIQIPQIKLANNRKINIFKILTFGALLVELTVMLMVIGYDVMYKDTIGIHERGQAYPFLIASFSHVALKIHLLLNYQNIPAVINAIIMFCVETG